MVRRLLICLLLAGVVAVAQTKIKTVPAAATSRVSGSEMYRTYCAVCHGLAGKGDGPAAVALKARPTDLTQLAKRNGGKYPDAKVNTAITAVPDMPAHGTSEMPIWGNIFRQIEGQGHEQSVKLRVYNLVKYLESIQGK